MAAQDGSRWVVGNGARHRITWTVDDTNVVPALRERVAVAAVCEAAALAGADRSACAIGPGAPVTTAPTAPPAQRPPSAAPGVPLDGRGGYTFFTNGPDTVDSTTVRTASFTLDRTRSLEACGEVADPAELSLLTAYLYERWPEGDEPMSLVVQDNQSGCWSMPKNPAPGSYYFQVTSFFQTWRVVVRAL